MKEAVKTIIGNIIGLTGLLWFSGYCMKSGQDQYNQYLKDHNLRVVDKDNNEVTVEFSKPYLFKKK